ncbi:hypothetical protein K440DRAFT_663078 [Wilcoxina mikolae CBS 423.85]|nr:hypothetical protein K440DRAFT_663078 [Wilcoxina mikolae CBS 423.85]
MKGLLQFSEVIGIFVQAKPEILSFIWGPVRFLLQVASAYPLAFDRLLDAFQAIGENLPRFEIYSKIFGDNIGMKNALVKFYKDILLFYQKALGFFRKKTWEILARCIWCPFESTFGTIFQDLSRHQKLIDDEASAAQVVASHKRDLLHNLEKWLQPADYAPHKFPLLGTGLWFVQNVDTQKWLDAGNTTSRWMWLTGNPGSGKTMLCVTLGNHIEKNMQNTGAIMSIFLKHGQGNASSFASVMRTLIHCILIKTPSALPFLEEQYHAIYPRPLDSADQFEQILRVVLDQYSRTIYLIIDGLDEIDNEERGSIISTLCRLRDIENLRVCFSSRSETDITDKLSHIYPVSIGSANDADIGTYITKEGEAVINQFKSCDYEGPEVECTIRDVLKKAKSKANGMFLLARLIIHELRACSTLEELEKAGDIMPSGLDEAYGRILERIHPDSPKKKLSDSEKSKACKILVWVICSFKPLKSDHIKKLLAIEVGNNHLDGRRKLIKRLEELCGPLLDLDKDGSVYIVHYSAKEYLTSPESRISASKNLGPLIGLENSHCYVATVCLTYLSFDCFSEGQTRDVDEMSQHICAGDYFFHEYAEVYWVEHVRHSIGADEQKRQQLYGTVQKFVTFQRDVRTALAFSFNKEHSQIRQSFPNDVYFAIMDYHLWNLTSEKALADAENNPWKLRGAIARIRQITENLLSSAVDPNDATTRSVLENMYGKAFFRCNFPYCKSYMEGFQTKEERDVHLNQHSRPFKCKISYCPYSTLGFPDDGVLAQHIADKHVSDDEADMSQLLSTLTMEDNAKSEAVVGSNRPDLLDIFRDAILSENASVVLACYNDVSFRRAVAEKGLSMLHYACAFDSRGVVIMLLDAGSLIDFECTQWSHIDMDGSRLLDVGIGDTPLHVVARLGHETMTKLLVERGANVDAENVSNETPLQIASSLGYQTLAQTLLEAKGNNGALAVSDEAGETPIKTSILRVMEKLEAPSTPHERGAEIRTLEAKLEVLRRVRLKQGDTQRQWGESKATESSPAVQTATSQPTSQISAPPTKPRINAMALPNPSNDEPTSHPPSRASSVAPTSSYWSVPEQTNFPHLLTSFGTNWGLISQRLPGKTTTMVRNFYTRQVDYGRIDYKEIADEADRKIKANEPLPPLPPFLKNVLTSST